MKRDPSLTTLCLSFLFVLFSSGVTFAAPARTDLVAAKSFPQLYPRPTQEYLRLTAPLQKPVMALSSPVQGALLTADLDGDGKPEVISCQSHKGLFVKSTTMKWEYLATVGRSIPAIGDLDGDKQSEIVISSCTSEEGPRTCHLHILSSTGELKQSVELPGEVRGAIVLYDLDGDKQMEIILTTQNSKLVVLERDGKMRKGFPKDLGEALPVSESIYVPSPAVGELDGRFTNGREIVAVSNAGQIHVFHADGTSLPAFPLMLNESVFASPMIGDFDGDGVGEFVVATSKGKLMIFSPNGSLKPGFPFQVRGQILSTPVWIDLNRDGNKDLFVATQLGFVYGLSVKGKLLPGWPRKVDAPVTASLIAADITTDARPELIVVSQAGSIYVYQKWGRQVIGYPVQTNQVVYATPVVTDLDRDGRADFLMAAHNKQIYIYEDQRRGEPGRFVGTASFRGGLNHAGSFANVVREADLTPRSENLPPGQPPPASPAEQPPKSSSGCSTLAFSPGSVPGSLFFFLLLLLVARPWVPAETSID